MSERRVPARLRPERLSAGDVIRVGSSGLRTRPLRIVLSAVGIAIGIAAMLAVVGISASSRAEVQRALDRLGTNLLTVTPGQNHFGEAAKLPPLAVSMVRRVGPVRSVSATGHVSTAKVYRNEHIPVAESGSLAVLAVNKDLLTGCLSW